MATIAENIQTLRSIKSGIKQAITGKGGSVGNDFKTYAQAITNLPSGGGGGNEDLINLIERDVTTLNIPDGTTKIGDYAFAYCKSIASVTIPNTVTKINRDAFYSCYSLTDVTIPDSVTEIGEFAFAYCKSIASVTIPNTVTKINRYTFSNCTALTDVTIPNSVTSIGDYAFNECSKLTNVTILATTPPTLDFSAFNFANNCPIYVPAESVNAYKTATNWRTYADRIQAIPTV